MEFQALIDSKDGFDLFNPQKINNYLHIHRRYVLCNVRMGTAIDHIKRYLTLYPASSSLPSTAASLAPLIDKNVRCGCARRSGRVRAKSHNQCTLSGL